MFKRLFLSFSALEASLLIFDTNMNPSLLFTNILQPPVLFFGLGLAAVVSRARLEIPASLVKAMSLYLLLAIGFKGGVELRASGLSTEVVLTMLAAIGMACLVPITTFLVARRKLDTANAAAVAATYGSVSAVTFIAATSFLDTLRVAHGGHMVAAMALMEAPAIVVGLALARRFGAMNPDSRGEGGAHGGWGDVLQDAFLNGSVFMLAGSFVIGLLTGESGKTALNPFTGDIFKGVLCLFLLEMGLTAGKKFVDLKGVGAFPFVWGLVAPLVHALVGLGLAYALKMPPGDALIFVILCASASYIAVPAAMRLALPQANPGLYVTMALAITFPFNLIIGMPLYFAAVKALWHI